MRSLLALLVLAGGFSPTPPQGPDPVPVPRVDQVGHALSPGWERLIAEVTNVCRSGQSCNVSSVNASSCVKVTGGSNTVATLPTNTYLAFDGTACGSTPLAGFKWDGTNLNEYGQFQINGTVLAQSGTQEVAGPSYSFLSTGTTVPGSGDFACSGAKSCVFGSSAATQSTTVQGGPSTAGAGATPGSVSGGVNLTTTAGGAGGSTGAAGASGAISCTTGAGGGAGSSTGNAASSGNWSAGTGAGGAGVLGGGAAATSGTVSLTTGTGGAGTSAAAAAPSGGITIQTGNAGAQNGGGGATVGAVTIDTGSATGAGALGSVNIGHTNAGTVNIGTSGGTVNILGGTGTLSIGGGSTTGGWSATSNGALVVAATTYGAFSQAGNNVGAKFGEVACTHSTAGAGTAGTLAVFDSTGATLCSGSYTCTTTANTPTAIFNCNTAPIVGRAYGVRFTTGCGTTQVTGLQCSVEIVH